MGSGGSPGLGSRLNPTFVPEVIIGEHQYKDSVRVSLGRGETAHPKVPLRPHPNNIIQHTDPSAKYWDASAQEELFRTGASPR